MNERDGFGRQKTLNLHVVFNFKKLVDPSRFVLRRKTLKTFAPCPLQEIQKLSKRKNNKPYFLFKNAQFFVEACKKFISTPGIRTILVIFNFTHTVI